MNENTLALCPYRWISFTRKFQLVNVKHFYKNYILIFEKKKSISFGLKMLILFRIRI